MPFATGADSPVSCDSLTIMSSTSKRRISAGTISPSRRTTTSPGTISFSGAKACWPPRTTKISLSTNFCNFSTAFSDRNSWKKPSPVLISSMAMITSPSLKSFRIKDRSAATSNRYTRELLNCFSSNSEMLFLLSFLSIFWP